MSSDQTGNDRFLASIARFLIDGGQEYAASVVLSCNLTEWESGDSWWAGDEQTFAVHVNLTGPRQAHDILHNDKHPITRAVRAAIQALLPPNQYLKHLTISAELVEIGRGLARRVV
jgi:hypothetical protein